MERIKGISLAVLIFAFVTSACSPQLLQTGPTALPTRSLESVSTPSGSTVPFTEAEVPRVQVDEAKAAFDAGRAIFVDVRDPDSFAASHIPGAVNIQLGEFETNPTGLNLDKNQWIITYCT